MPDWSIEQVARYSVGALGRGRDSEVSVQRGRLGSVIRVETEKRPGIPLLRLRDHIICRTHTAIISRKSVIPFVRNEPRSKAIEMALRGLVVPGIRGGEIVLTQWTKLMPHHFILWHPSIELLVAGFSREEIEAVRKEYERIRIPAQASPRPR